jgi:hypothetical protein
MTLKEQLEKNKILIVSVAIIGLGVGFFAWNSSLFTTKTKVQKKKEEELAADQMEKIDVDFNVLESAYLKELEKIGTIPEYQQQIGRDNPFVRP